MTSVAQHPLLSCILLPPPFLLLTSATLYLITEHVVCETMDNQLTCDPDSIGTKAPMTVPDVMKHISGILEGMELIESYGVRNMLQATTFCMDSLIV